ncbi:MAG: Tm-1-like ATP-binding domain-containing protein, partial [Deltaproteobacteria bacterium]|nr:Tm-1-like ATP-binding domain-containing protein [Deltaproteobacteria bacterium]
MPKHIVILSTLDTKGEEAGYLKALIDSQGFNTILIDTSIGGEATINPDISSEEVAAAGGGNIRDIRASRNTGEVTPIMIKGAGLKVLQLLSDGKLDGIVSFGGASNTTSATTIMKELPFGIPKLMVSSTASMPAYAAMYIGTKDITMMHSVVDISGINYLTKAVLERAAGGICGMTAASHGAVKPRSASLLIALTTFKFAEECGQHAMALLEQKGYTVIPFHAQGIGDKAMEELIDQKLFQAVIDLVPAGVSEELLGGNRAAGPHRLEAAGRVGIPQVITPCGFDMLSCGPLSRREKADPLWTTLNLAERKIFIPDEFRVLARTTAGELQKIAALLADKLNRAKGPVKLLIPTKGWSTLSVEGADLHDPETDAVFAPALRERLRPAIEIRELPMAFDSPEFAEA